MRKYKGFCFGLFLGALGTIPSSLRADDEETHNIAGLQNLWFTGPLLSPPGYTVKPGHVNIQPYTSVNITTGTYNNHWKAHSTDNFYSTNEQIQTRIGLAKGLDFQIFPQVYFNKTKNKHYTGFGDLPVGINIQLLTTTIKDPWPAIKLTLRANAPTGKYQHLNPNKKGTDAIGAGSWLPAGSLILAKLWNTSGTHFLESRLYINYQIGTAVLVKGLNSYGGAKNTKGFVYPGNVLTVDAAFQYNLAQNWDLACDFYYTYSNKNRFSGNPGTLANGTKAKMTNPSKETWSIAPALEYNWSSNIGLIAGVWFSLAGRNSSEFMNPMIALNIYI